MPGNEYVKNEVFAEQPLNGYQLPGYSSFELRSEEVQDIISKMPHWVVRRGTTVLFVVMILLFTGAFFIHYPDVIITSVSITSTNPPVRIVAQSSGKIRQIFVQNNERVQKDGNICLLENPADFQDITLLKGLLNRLDTALDLTQTLRTASFNQRVQLGELQAGYADLFLSISQYQFFTGRNFAEQKLAQLQSQIEYQAQLNKELQKRDMLLKQQLELENKKFLADSSLVADKVIAPLEFDNSRKELIDKQMNADATRSGILENKLQQTEFLKTITDLKQQKLQQENDLRQKIRENVKRLLGELALWERKYLVKSPVEGKVAFFKFWKENQYVSNGEDVLMVVPPIQHYIARATLPVDGAGKVKVGQKVLVKLSSYPFEEFGMITGQVATVSSVTFDTAYAMEISLTNGLKTTTLKQIPALPQLTGIAEVLTNDKNIVERLFEKIWVKTVVST